MQLNVGDKVGIKQLDENRNMVEIFSGINSYGTVLDFLESDQNDETTVFVKFGDLITALPIKLKYLFKLDNEERQLNLTNLLTDIDKFLNSEHFIKWNELDFNRLGILSTHVFNIMLDLSKILNEGSCSRSQKDTLKLYETMLQSKYSEVLIMLKLVIDFPQLASNNYHVYTTTKQLVEYILEYIEELK